MEEVNQKKLDELTIKWDAMRIKREVAKEKI